MIYAQHRTAMPSGEFSVASGKIPVNVDDLAPEIRALRAAEIGIKESAKISGLKLQ